jgi:predicted DNA-binding protein
MATITVRLPDEKYERLKQLARHQGVSVNKLFEELSTAALAEFDVETRFLVRAGRGSAKRGLELLEKLNDEASV